MQCLRVFLFFSLLTFTTTTFASNPCAEIFTEFFTNTRAPNGAAPQTAHRTPNLAELIAKLQPGDRIDFKVPPFRRERTGTVRYVTSTGILVQTVTEGPEGKVRFDEGVDPGKITAVEWVGPRSSPNTSQNPGISTETGNVLTEEDKLNILPNLVGGDDLSPTALEARPLSARVGPGLDSPLNIEDFFNRGGELNKGYWVWLASGKQGMIHSISEGPPGQRMITISIYGRTQLNTGPYKPNGLESITVIVFELSLLDNPSDDHRITQIQVYPPKPEVPVQPKGPLIGAQTVFASLNTGALARNDQYGLRSSGKHTDDSFKPLEAFERPPKVFDFVIFKLQNSGKELSYGRIESVDGTTMVVGSFTLNPAGQRTTFNPLSRETISTSQIVAISEAVPPPEKIDPE